MAKKIASKSLDLIKKIKSKEDERITCTLSLDREQYERLRDVAEDEKIKISHIIDGLIKEFLSGIDKK